VVELTRSEVMGIGIDRVRECDVVARVLDGLEQGRGGRIVTPNVDILRQATRDRELRELLAAAELVVADGAPVVWASHLQGTPLPERVAGATMMVSLCAAAADARRSVFLLGGTPGTGEVAAERLRDRHPGLECDWHCPPYGFERSEQALAEVEDALDRSRPDIVFCGFGFPKQERLMQRLAPRFPGVWFCGVGASIGFVAGEFRRAPEWVQRSGFEWLYRLGQEPRRLFSRYVVHDMPFALRLFGDALRRRWGLGSTPGA
jgi:N-acetylglucosaminyldiphosphoundecaprenol N-acetyl-beta-D-mannosaminyltransferase